MGKFRIYALILGEILPEGLFLDCSIKKLDFAEQEKRSFSPIQGIFSSTSTDQHKTYVTSLPYVDPIRIKSEYVVIYDIEEKDVNSALGGAIKQIDKLCRILSVAYVEDTKQNFKKEYSLFQPYIYQINKIYSLDDNGSEVDLELKLENSYIYSPDRPSSNNWRHNNTQGFLEELLSIHDETLERALQYLYRSTIGQFILDSPEKIVLDHMKSIEIIVDSLSKKKCFLQRLEEAKLRLELTDEEQENIKKLWDIRSKYGDTAHFSKFDEVERYPNQFPLPSNSEIHGLPSNAYAINVCLKYFRYKQRLYQVDLKVPDDYHKEGVMVIVNPQTETNHFYLYITPNSNKVQLKQNIKSAFVSNLGITEDNIESMELG